MLPLTHLILKIAAVQCNHLRQGHDAGADQFLVSSGFFLRINELSGGRNPLGFFVSLRV